jgi:thiol-disulfide isomerase/thioredoxin
MYLYSLNNIRVVFVLLFTIANLKNYGQSTVNTFPKIGDHFPNFLLNDLHYFSKTKASSADFKGKPIILDFFSAGCEACFLSFPHVDSLKKEFEGRVLFILVGKKSPGLSKQFDNYRKHYGLDIPVDYDDSTIWNQFGVMLVPYTVWIDSSGIIKQITSSYALSKDRINNLIGGMSQPLGVSANQSDAKPGLSGFYGGFFNRDKPLLIGGNGGADTSFLYRSILCNWDYRMYFSRDLYISTKNKNRVQEIGVPLTTFFNLAYGDTVRFQEPTFRYDNDLPNHYGEWARYPLIESSRQFLFESDQDSSKNMFSYSLIIPDSNVNARELQHIMQNDLKNYFHLEATVETRKMPCWKIVALKNAEKLIRTKGGEPQWTGSFSNFTLQNQPVSSLLVEIWGFHQKEFTILDETSINYNIDLKIDAVMSDMHDIQKALQKNGLDIVMGEKEMKVIVVRDSKDF